ncbi:MULTISPECIES: ABC transporter ATP-binding protein [Paenibacillus]|uniref:ATP-binding cassette domain-containing protein n=2 Tax=Paenibacillus macerans TaxID=44252 RepID=A0A6N8ESH8_PAEMA|nr:ABC transporter ATP-binding protein [Paenibacillus macerans]MBS5909922.1 ABC transporter ATP-binding protein [Paenibacillus macerans]MUG21703.1 ATP-binding cassette domain-containing protein [Paenibacillus macerans]UMV46326.1 ABC transporter ATP-binding protein/permease [Paenibacillus macerans]GBK63479.1 ABC transporter ATP-binding protein [Paenibacillus macerans]GBK69791.1 ABC transporter ATP-binding protein [Paenibacillus macerans]
MHAHTGKSLFKYALTAKNTFILALVMLAIGVAAELAGPFIARAMIDDHMLAIEQPFYETASQDESTVLYDGRYFKRGDRFAESEAKGGEVRVLQAGTSFLFIDEPVADVTGDRSFKDGVLTIARKDGTVSEYPAQKLSASGLFAFYKPEVPGIISLIIWYFVFLAVSIVMEFGKTYWLQSSANKVIRKLRMDVYAHIQRLPVYFFDNLPAGKVVSRVTNDTEAVKDLFIAVLANFFSGIINMLGVYVALFILDVRLGLICLFIVPVIYLWVVLYRKFATKYNTIIRSRLSEINAIINESIQGMSIIRIFRREAKTKAEFENLNDDYMKHQNKMLNLNAFTSHNLVNVIRNLAFAAVLWYFGSAQLGGDSVISLGVLYAFVDVLGRLFQPITGMVNQLAALDTSMVSAGRVFALMDEPGEDVTDGSMPRYKGNVEFKDVSFAYKQDYVLKNISFEAKQGQTVALVGHTGSGKSSIINLLFRFYDPQKGLITIDGQPVKDLPKQWIRRHMGIVLQDPYLFTGTILSNVTLGDERISREAAEQALRDVGATRILAHLPKGLDEPVVEKGSTLSAGERQLISFARALAFDPAILILDEATANIDTETEALIQNALEVLKRGRTTFIIAHRLSTIRSADQILVLHRGEIAERGTHDELLAMGGRYYQMYRLQHGGAEAPGAPAAGQPWAPVANPR